MCCVFLSKPHYISLLFFTKYNVHFFSFLHLLTFLFFALFYILSFAYKINSLSLYNINSSIFHQAKFRRMQQQESLKREFLKKWIISLQSFNSSKVNNMTLFQRKNAIKLSANLAMASTRNSSISWSRTVISKANNEDGENGNLAKKILAQFDKDKCSSLSSKFNKHSLRTSFSKICKVRRHVPRKVGPFCSNKVAKRLVKKRTQILKGLVPGGECMDECCLIKETLDYIVSLRAQVDVMYHLANSLPII